MNSLTVPLIIHSDTIVSWLSIIITPNNGNTFWWRRDFHVTTSLQNLYVVEISRPTHALSNTENSPS